MKIVNQYVYGLVDPNSGLIRYIGQTHRPDSRMLSHVREAMSKKGTHKRHWLRGLVQAGQEPRMVILRTFQDRESALACERHYIEMLWECGVPLVNAKNGGEGVVPGSKMSAAHRAAMARWRAKDAKATAMVEAANRYRITPQEIRKAEHREWKRLNPEAYEALRLAKETRCLPCRCGRALRRKPGRGEQCNICRAEQKRRRRRAKRAARHLYVPTPCPCGRGLRRASGKKCSECRAQYEAFRALNTPVGVD